MRRVWREVWLGILLALGTAGCDAGPSAVLHDGDGKAPAAEVRTAPGWAEGKPGQNAADDIPADDVEQASMPIPGAPRESAQEGPGDLQAKNLETSRAYAALVVPKTDVRITATRYGDWPLWSSNRKYSADDNARYHFDKHGAEVGARSYGEFVAVVHGFVHNPPKGTQTLRRNNGDTLFYDARTNVFAVMTKNGAPRTLFLPYEGAAYWQKQKQIEAERRTVRESDE